MKKLIITLLFLAITTTVYCQSHQHNGSLFAQNEAVINKTVPIDEFESLLKEKTNGQLVDVRTPGEYGNEHLANSANIDFHSSDFAKKIATLDKKKPVFVYCLGGGRSGAAAEQMKKMGFTEVYNMDGGIMKWRSAGKPLENGSAAGNDKETGKIKKGSKGGISKVDFDKMVNKPNYVLVDFNAKWCAPCKKMMPVFESLAKEKKDKLTLVKIDADENGTLCNEKNIDAIPYLELYNNGKLVWHHSGYISKEDFLKETKL